MRTNINIDVLFRMSMQRISEMLMQPRMMISIRINLLKPLFTKKICSYRPENYWKYEICHGKYIRQFHEDPGIKGSIQEYYLGTFDMDDFAKYEKIYEQMDDSLKLPMINIEDMQLPYIEVNMTGGTLCDLSNKKRFTRVLYVCNEIGKHELYSIKETTTCEYEVIVLSSLLCLSPKFKLKKSIENNINCHVMDKNTNKVPKGFELGDIELEMKTQKSKVKQNIGDSFLESKTILINTFDNGKEVRINFIAETDDYDGSLLNSHSHIIAKFLRGEYCLTGGSGWWKYEFCYGKSVNQFHEEKGEKRMIINLGKWNLDSHIEWIQKDLSRKPKPGKTPKQVWHYYSSGDFCELTQRPRTVEVKLKCRYDPSNPDSVAIYLMEPRTCEYILGVESPIICDLISNVDEYGIFQFSNEE
ncbi:endoplasmic reticulum lectin 1 isoform X2 [Dermatophagoides farinae]|uniref:endoplasmic reticulum lectin 1 isoform X2 n=1 Tax=Dermatophagoides farinae TaxID=6954 RepID=UPI003F613487